ncbi:MAG: hypothetical protein F6K03_11035, partial [Kamptonema sp. SIO4C4]|nr:hypothetical protein [Kamptonema sp. SIO4C4]
MSEEVRNSPNANPDTQASTLPALDLEDNADELMDDVFSDIDSMLNGRSSLPTKTVKADYVALESVVVPPLNVSSSDANS